MMRSRERRSLRLGGRGVVGGLIVSVRSEARSVAVERMSALLAATSGRALSERERDEWFALPVLVEAGPGIDRVDGPWQGVVEAVDELTPFYVRAALRAPDGGRFALRVGVEPEPPHRIRYASRWHYPGDVVTREATEGDGEAIAELERRTPVVDGNVRRRYDRRGGWFDQLRLMDDTTVVVAEIDGRIIGAHVDAIHEVPIGVPRRLLYRLRTRVDPAYQGRHVFPALNGAAVDARVPFERVGWGFDSEEMFVALGNERIRNLTAERSNVVEWGTPIERLLIDCAQAARSGPIEDVSVADLDEVTDLFRASRGDEVGYPYRTADDVRLRFERAPSVYGWTNVLKSGQAILGIWNEQLRISTEVGEDRQHMACALALDYGCATGHTADLAELVRSACTQLQHKSVTHLIMYTSPGAYLRETLMPLATRIERFGRRIRVPEPPDCPRRGVYVDPIYF